MPARWTVACRSKEKMFAVAENWVTGGNLNWMEVVWHCTWRSRELQLVVGLHCFPAAFCKRDPSGIPFREQDIAMRVLENWSGRCWRAELCLWCWVWKINSGRRGSYPARNSDSGPEQQPVPHGLWNKLECQGFDWHHDCIQKILRQISY